MPPHRRRPSPTSGQAPPIRRPKVAGRHNRPGHTGELPAVRPDAEPPAEEEQENVSGVLDGVLGAPPRTEPTDEQTGDEDRSPGRHRRPRPAKRAVDDRDEPDADRAEDAAAADTADDTADADTRAATEKAEPAGDSRPAKKKVAAGARPAGKREPASGRPAGKRRSTGSARPEDLAAAETGAGAEPRRPSRAATPRSKASRQISVAAVLAVVAVALGALAVFFRGEASDLTSGDSNSAMTDMGATTQVKSQITEAVNKTFSYNYTDLDSTAKAVEQRLTGKALCEYNLLFNEVKKYAPEQKIILNTEVRDLGVIRIDGDRAEALVYIDQVSTRVDVNKAVSVRGQFAVQAHKDGNDWKITKFDMFGQPLFNGKPAPKC